MTVDRWFVGTAHMRNSVVVSWTIQGKPDLYIYSATAEESLALLGKINGSRYLFHSGERADPFHIIPGYGVLDTSKILTIYRPR